MVSWDVERSPMSVQLLVRLGADHGLPAQACLESTRLTEESLRDTGATVSARQELTVIANLLRALAPMRFAGFDVVEVSPPYDSAGQITAATENGDMAIVIVERRDF